MRQQHDCVSLRKLYQIANGTAVKYGLPRISHKQVTDMYLTPFMNLMPIVKHNETGTIWVDKYYVAYMLDDEEVHYTYIARYHIYEEVASFNKAAKERGIKSQLPEDVKNCFQEAVKQMQRRGLKCWIARPWIRDTLEDLPDA